VVIIAPAISCCSSSVCSVALSLGVSFQHRTMLEDDKSFAGFLNYAQLFKAARLWQIAAAYRRHHGDRRSRRTDPGHADGAAVLERLPGRQVFVLCSSCRRDFAVRCRCHWRLLFDNRYGPINQIIGWFGQAVAALWTVKPCFVYPAIILCEIWQWTPFMFLILLAALSNVDKSLTEAAEIDWRRLLAHLRQDRALAGDLAG
jgi:multiple sugar transport system permease protein